MSNKSSSPSRTYVAMCEKTSSEGHEGYRLRRFKLPERYLNDTEVATWYYLNRIDSFSCMDHSCITAEDYSAMTDVPEEDIPPEIEYDINPRGT